MSREADEVGEVHPTQGLGEVTSVDTRQSSECGLRAPLACEARPCRDLEIEGCPSVYKGHCGEAVVEQRISHIL